MGNQSELFKGGWAMETRLRAEWTSAVKRATEIMRAHLPEKRRVELIEATNGAYDAIEPWSRPQGMTGGIIDEPMVLASFGFALRMLAVAGPVGTLDLDGSTFEQARKLFWLSVETFMRESGVEIPAPSASDNARLAVREIEDLLYPGGDVDHQWGVDDLDDIARILSKHGYGRDRLLAIKKGG